GHIQVACQPGVTVIIDGVHVGNTESDFGGLIIPDVSPGAHTVQLRSGGYVLKRDEIHVNPGQVYLYWFSVKWSFPVPV
nr:PEGA domain-containing protein [bacterium]